MAEERPPLVNAFYDLLKDACERASENAVKTLYEWSLVSSERDAQVPPPRATKPERGAQYVPQESRKSLLSREIWPRLKKLPPESEVATLRRISLDILANDKNMRDLKATWKDGLEALRAYQEAVSGRSIPARQSPALPAPIAIPSTQLSSTSSLTTLPSSSQPQPSDTQVDASPAQLIDQPKESHKDLPAGASPQAFDGSVSRNAYPAPPAESADRNASPPRVPASVEGGPLRVSGGQKDIPAPPPATAPVEHEAGATPLGGNASPALGAQSGGGQASPPSSMASGEVASPDLIRVSVTDADRAPSGAAKASPAPTDADPAPPGGVEASVVPAAASVSDEAGAISGGAQASLEPHSASGGQVVSLQCDPRSVVHAAPASSGGANTPPASAHSDPPPLLPGQKPPLPSAVDAARAPSGGADGAQVPSPPHGGADAPPAAESSSASDTRMLPAGPSLSVGFPPALPANPNGPVAHDQSSSPGTAFGNPSGSSILANPIVGRAGSPHNRSPAMDGHAPTGDQDKLPPDGRSASSAPRVELPDVEGPQLGTPQARPTAAYFPPPSEGPNSGSQSSSFPPHGSTSHGPPNMKSASYTSPDAPEPSQSSGDPTQDNQMDTEKPPARPHPDSAQSTYSMLLEQDLPTARRRLYLLYSQPFYNIPDIPFNVDVYLIRQTGPPPSWILAVDQIKDRFNRPPGFVGALPSSSEGMGQETNEVSDPHAAGEDAAQELSEGDVDSTAEGHPSTARPQPFYLRFTIINPSVQAPVSIGIIPPASTRMVGGGVYTTFPDPLPAELKVPVFVERAPLALTWKAWLTVLTIVDSYGTFTWDSDVLVQVGLMPPMRRTHPRLVLADCDFKECMWSYLQSICIALSNASAFWWNLIDCYGCPLAHVSFGRITSVSEQWFRQAPLDPHLVSWKNNYVAYTATVDALPVSVPEKGHALDAVQAQWLQDFLIARDTINMPSYPTFGGLEEINSTKFVRTKAECTAAKQTENPQLLDVDALRGVLWRGPHTFSNYLRIPSDLSKANVDFVEIDINLPSQVAHIDTFIPILDFFLGQDVICDQIRKMPQEGGRTYNGVQFWTVEDMVKGCSCPSTIVFAWSSLEDIKKAMAPLPLPPVLQAELQAGRRGVPIAQVVARYFNCTVAQVAGACKLHLMILRPDFLDQLASYRIVRYPVEPTNKKWTAMFTLTNADHILDADGAVNPGKLATAKRNQKVAKKKAKSEAKALARAQAEAQLREQAATQKRKKAAATMAKEKPVKQKRAKAAADDRAKAPAKAKGKAKADDGRPQPKSKRSAIEPLAPVKKRAAGSRGSKSKGKAAQQDSDTSSASDVSDDGPEESERSAPSASSEHSEDGEGDLASLAGMAGHGAANAFEDEDTSTESEGAAFGFRRRQADVGDDALEFTSSDQSLDEDEQPSQDELDPSADEVSGLPSDAEGSDALDAVDGDGDDDEDEDEQEDEEEDEEPAVRRGGGRSRSLQAPSAPPQIRRLVFEQGSRQGSKEPSRRSSSKKKSRSQKPRVPDASSDSDAVKTEPEEDEDDRLMLLQQGGGRARAQSRGLGRSQPSRLAPSTLPMDSDEEDASDGRAGATKKRSAKSSAKTKRPVAREPSHALVLDAPPRKKNKGRDAAPMDPPPRKLKNKRLEGSGDGDDGDRIDSPAPRKKAKRAREVDESEDEHALAEYAAARKSKKRREREEVANLAPPEAAAVAHKKKVKRAREGSSTAEAGARASSSRLTPYARGPSVPPKMRARGKKKAA